MSQSLSTQSAYSTRQIDALIAYHRLRWQWYTNRRDPSSSIYSLHPRGTELSGWQKAESEPESLFGLDAWYWSVPNFSSDLGKIWGEVEKLTEKHYDLTLNTCALGRWSARFNYKADMGQPRPQEWVGVANHPALAICIAILKIYGVRV